MVHFSSQCLIVMVLKPKFRHRPIAWMRSKRIIQLLSFILLLAFLSIIIVFWKSKSGLETIHPQNRNKLLNLFNHFNKLTFKDKSSKTLKELKSGELEILERRSRVKNLCKSYHLGSFSYPNGTNDLGLKDPPTPQYSYFFHNKDWKLSWCPVYKAGSTSWLYNMMRLKGFTEAQLKAPKKQLSVWAREVYGYPITENEFQNSFKLLIVRHPFERLLSAYRDKLSSNSSGHETGYFYSKYGFKIVRDFRTDPSIKQSQPTFEEFIRYLLHTNLILYSDDHWLPIYYSCTPCHLNYDLIAKTETLMRDEILMIQRLGLDRTLISPTWKHQNSDGESQDSHELMVKTYFSQLSKGQIRQLFQKYWLDFELFGYYSPDKYISYGRRGH